MGIYHFSADIIGRSSGRSSVGAAAYRAGEKLQAIGAAAYRSGEDLRDDGAQITHDYTRKRGVKHKEIMPPKNAPPEYKDRETLWNAVENRSNHKKAQFAREIVVALQREFELQEQIEILREYIRENFVDKGMCADFAVHDKGDGNPHAHIMLTLRDVSPKGFGKVNRDWSKTAELVGWRKNWADINNRFLEKKGLDERIDHRTLKAQGINREPTIHMGHEATALERRGVKTERGDYNREIKRRNAERETEKAEHMQESAEIAANINDGKIAPKNNCGDTERRALMSAKRNMRTLEEQLKAEKAEQIIEKLQAQRAAREEAEKIAKHLNELQEQYITLEQELRTLKDFHEEEKHNQSTLRFRIENIDEHVKHIETLQNKLNQLQAERKKLHFWEKEHKEKKNKQIELIDGERRISLVHLKVRYGIKPEQAPEEINKIQAKIHKFTHTQTEQIPELSKKLDEIEKEYHQQKLLSQIRPDNEQIEKLLEKRQKSPETVRERLHYERINRRLNTIAEENVEEIIKKWEQQQAQKVRDMMERHREERVRIREKERERERLRERDRNRSYTISR